MRFTVSRPSKTTLSTRSVEGRLALSSRGERRLADARTCKLLMGCIISLARGRNVRPEAGEGAYPEALRQFKPVGGCLSGALHDINCSQCCGWPSHSRAPNKSEYAGTNARLDALCRPA